MGCGAVMVLKFLYRVRSYARTVPSSDEEMTALARMRPGWLNKKGQGWRKEDGGRRCELNKIMR